MDDENEPDSMIEAVRDMILDFPDCDHLILNEEDAKDCGLPEHIDDEGIRCFIVDGKRLYVHPECPIGLIGACVGDEDDDFSVNCSTIGEA